ncbi:AP-4 complex subunit epsilon [Camellia lanceoleosa]|uniref:AP-4 complex subunit epsilon n=1 Tax=Camellia lanceoleosa TaxID=1840588 RepID=A0ACC0G5W9_9ERIC|nr:AP-4 complex subunit epsilon [Camellia lanceoleosa]
MGATLCPLFDLITIDANSYKDLVISFVSILKLVAERRLPKIYEYHQMAAPFIQLFNCEHMYTVVGDIMRKCDSSSNIGNAVLYQCICCVSSIHPNPKLLDAAADAISKFLKSGSHNLKYMGIDALGRLIKISPEIAIDCLEVESYLCIIGEPKLPSAFLQVICWVFGEYETADGQHSGSYITGKLCDVAEAHSSDDTVKAYAVTALTKIYAFETAAGRKVDVLPGYQSFIEELSASHSTDLQQRAYELQAVIGLDAHVVESIMPLDASCEDIQISKGDISQTAKGVTSSFETAIQPPPDLLDVNHQSVTSAAPCVDRFKQLEGLLDPSQDASALN